INQKLSIPAGEVLFEEGAKANSLNILHSGGIALEKEVNGKSIPLLELSGKNLTPGILSLFSGETYQYTIKATSPSLLSTYQVNAQTIRKTLSSKLSIGNMIARTLFMETGEFLKKVNHIHVQSSNLERLNDNLSLAYYFYSPTAFPDINLDNPEAIQEVGSVDDKVLNYVRKNVKQFFTHGGAPPEKIDVAFIKANLASNLAKSYGVKKEIQEKDFHFIRKIIGLKSDLLAHIYKADVSILVYICERLAEVNQNILNDYLEVIDTVHNNFAIFCGNQSSMVEKYNMQLDLTKSGVGTANPEHFSEVSEFLSFSLNNYLNFYKSTFFFEYPTPSTELPQFQELSREFAANFQPQDAAAASAGEDGSLAVGDDFAAAKKDLENSSAKILAFAGLELEKKKEFSSLLLKLKSLKNPLDSDSDVRKVRRNITKTYWDVYERCLKKYLQSKTATPVPVQMMLKFGYFDETLLEEEHVQYLYKQNQENDKLKDEYGKFDGVEWLESIYKKEFTTSLDELGQTFFEKIKLESKSKVFKRESDLTPDVDNGDTRLSFELNSMYVNNVKLTTGNPTTHLPILTKHHISLPLEKCFISEKVLSDTLNEILAVDNTAFYREVIYNDPDLGLRNEMVWTSVVPDFIFVPSIGDRIMMWQPLSVFRGSGSKESTGRVVIPRFATSADFKTMLLEAIGSFRWELTKEIAGVDWLNPGVPSITSAYNDYAEFYKKNKDLSIEQKEKITEEFRRFRSHKDRFINDYISWVKSEAEGIQKLNRVVRNIFYRHIPFAPEIRQRVATMPAYIDINTRFTNIRNREFKEKETRYRKYQNLPGGLPKKLQDNLDYYKK
ncbi:MAG: cyclic nucleotide-binding domain-containing protein, partial [Spirochaetota bacterium]